jgi:hypothetical protein
MHETAPSFVMTTTVVAGPVATVAAVAAMTGSAWLHESLFGWALLGALVLWCPFFPASMSAMLLGPWRDHAALGVRGLARGAAVTREMLVGPARTAFVANAAAWTAAAALAGVLAR